jgi:peptidoglycan/xylan/chitin deacetylase (PgdA/CDA1 family)
VLKPGGVLLVTAPSIIRVDDEAGADGDFWRLTEASARRLFAAVFPVDAFDVTSYGNVLACAAFLYGISVEELDPAELDSADPNFPVVVAIRAVKPRVPKAAAVATSRTASAAAPAASFSAAVLAYHRIAELRPDSHELCTPPAEFRAHMDYLRRTFCPMSLEDLVCAAASGNIPDRAVAVTLDDGYVDALTTASPILLEHRIPATFFVNSDRLSEPHERWWDILERIFLIEPDVPPTLALDVAGRRQRLPTSTRAERIEALEQLNRAAWTLDAGARLDMAAAVAAWSGTAAEARAAHRVLTGSEVRELADRPGHTIGAHTIHHLALTTQPIDTKRREVVANKGTLETLLQRPVDLFAYPYGDFDGEVTGVVRDAGFRAGFTIQTGLVSAATNRLLLPRCEVSRQIGFSEWLRDIFEGHR